MAGKNFDKLYSDYTNFSSYVTNKEKAIKNEIAYMLNRTQSMFHYENLPKTMPALELELILQTKGNAFVTKHNNELYVFSGSAGGELDEYYRPTIYTVTNPALKISANYKINIDGILIKNDSLEMGLLPLFIKYTSLLVENKISIRQAIINARVLSIITANDDRTKNSADLFLKKIENGELSAILETPFFEGVKSFAIGSSTNKNLSQLIEVEQYLKASLFNEIGLDANYNMKRSQISANEAELNDDFLLPLIDDLMNCRRNAINEINKMFDTDIKIDFASTWLTNELENKKEQEIYKTLNADNVAENIQSSFSENQEMTIKSDTEKTVDSVENNIDSEINSDSEMYSDYTNNSEENKNDDAK